MEAPNQKEGASIHLGEARAWYVCSEHRSDHAAYAPINFCKCDRFAAGSKEHRFIGPLVSCPTSGFLPNKYPAAELAYDNAVADVLADALQSLPGDWQCPICGAGKRSFQNKAKTLAGFEQNMQYGFGTNTMTSGQKSLLIYGSLIAFFGLFLFGYLLQ